MERETFSECVVNILRGCTRPILSIFLTLHWAMLLWAVMEGGGSFADIDFRYTTFVWGIDLWWFGDRTILKGKSIASILKGDK